MDKQFIENLTLKIISLAVIIVSVLDLIGILDNITWISSRIPKVILLLLGTVILLLINSMKTINSNIEKINSGGVDILEFDNAAEIYDYVSTQLNKAKHSIEDITWGSYTGYRTKDEQDAYERYVKTMQKVCKKKNIMYKEISSLSDEHYFERATKLFINYNYHLSYHNIDEVNVPLISYAIIDNEQVICGFSRVPGQVRPLDGIKYLSIKSPVLVKFFKDYYDTIWEKAEKIKESLIINDDKISLIEKRIKNRRHS